MAGKKPWWFPVICDEQYFRRLREDYPEHADMEDDELLEHYNDGCKYIITWSGISEGIEEFEKLADAYLKLLEETA